MCKNRTGFSLVQLSILIAAGGLIAAATLPSQSGDDVNAKYLITKKRMEKIEEATVRMMATWGRRPCPASGNYQPGDAAFGTEDGSDKGDCVASRVSATGIMQFDDTNVVAGTVPVKKLHLPYEYAYDGWGRPFTYVVDKRATDKASCTDSSLHKGDVLITNNGTMETVMSTLISHGPDGYGSYLPQGSLPSARFDPGSTDADQIKNAGGSIATTPYINDFVKKAKTDTFDDYVWFSDRYKNTCCVGKVCSQSASSPMMQVSGQHLPYGNGKLGDQGVGTTFNGFRDRKLVTDVDINGDGLLDIAMVENRDIATVAHTFTKLRVIYGKVGRDNFPDFITTEDIGTTVDGFSLEGDSTFGGRRLFEMTSVDANLDGHQDLIITITKGWYNGGTYATYPARTIIFFGGIPIAPGDEATVYPASINWATWTPDGVHNTQFITPGGWLEHAFGDFNGDGYPDIAYTWKTGYYNSTTPYYNRYVSVVWGKSGGWGSGFSIPYYNHNTTAPSAPTGYTQTVLSGAAVVVDISNPPDGVPDVPDADLHYRVDSGDFNGDGITDLVLDPQYYSIPNTDATTGRTCLTGKHISIVFGSAALASAGTVDVTALDGTNGIRVLTDQRMLPVNYAQNGVFSKAHLVNVNNDFKDDLVVTSAQCNVAQSDGPLILFGGTGPRSGNGTVYGPWSSYNPYSYTNLVSPAATAGIVGFRAKAINTTNNVMTDDDIPMADLNNDGKDDLIWGGGYSIQIYFGLSATDTGPTSPRLSDIYRSGITPYAVNYGDFDSDGKKDLFFSDPAVDYGRVVFFKGPMASTYPSYAGGTTGAGLIVTANEAASADDFGALSSVVDLDNDGINDIVVSNPESDGGYATYPDAGMVYVIWGPFDLGGGTLVLNGAANAYSAGIGVDESY